MCVCVCLIEKNETDTNVGQRGMRWQEVTAISPTSANARQNFQANTFFDVDNVNEDDVSPKSDRKKSNASESNKSNNSPKSAHSQESQKESRHAKFGCKESPKESRHAKCGSKASPKESRHAKI